MPLFFFFLTNFGISKKRSMTRTNCCTFSPFLQREFHYPYHPFMVMPPQVCVWVCSSS